MVVFLLLLMMGYVIFKKMLSIVMDMFIYMVFG